MATRIDATFAALNKAARPDRYVKKVDLCTSFAARTM